jgi:hypothetical protein
VPAADKSPDLQNVLAHLRSNKPVGRAQKNQRTELFATWLSSRFKFVSATEPQKVVVPFVSWAPLTRNSVEFVENSVIGSSILGPVYFASGRESVGSNDPELFYGASLMRLEMGEHVFYRAAGNAGSSKDHLPVVGYQWSSAAMQAVLEACYGQSCKRLFTRALSEESKALELYAVLAMEATLKYIMTTRPRHPLRDLNSYEFMPRGIEYAMTRVFVDSDGFREYAPETVAAISQMVNPEGTLIADATTKVAKLPAPKQVTSKRGGRGGRGGSSKRRGGRTVGAPGTDVPPSVPGASAQ